eukprot:6464055-Amphidinium_carterae.2
MSDRESSVNNHRLIVIGVPEHPRHCFLDAHKLALILLSVSKTVLVSALSIDLTAMAQAKRGRAGADGRMEVEPTSSSMHSSSCCIA